MTANEPNAESLPVGPLPGRRAARIAIVAPYGAMMVMCVFRQLAKGEELSPIGLFWFYAASTAATGMLGVGVVCGILGVIAGLRNKSWDTTIIASLGLLVSGVFISLAVIAYLFVVVENVPADG